MEALWGEADRFRTPVPPIAGILAKSTDLPVVEVAGSHTSTVKYSVTTRTWTEGRAQIGRE